MKVLIIEDQQELSDSIMAYLARENFACEVAYDFETAREKVNKYEYSCIILDISLPLGNGLNILKELKARDKAEGVLIISARNSLDDKLHGLNLGADDYLTKPFHLPELAARVNAIIRRMSFEGKNKIVQGSLSLNLRDKTVTGAKGPIPLTRKEYDLLVYFMANINKVVTKEAIVEHLWGDNIDMDDNYDFVYAHIKNLRKKLMQGGCPDHIKAIYGMGYKFTAIEEKKR
ncbi:response regulator transcription factor [Puia dinghuensis]|uniref:DNA-binding response regulator n=1 Tax=Puia dinghuensis TaxID=1792502 RepID=A0A8J2XSC9_9BACT|nr:response regulator transcription factor [Puia dinghuensis]GGA90532.1 DNA-binding response regulator [Puia dinghuensis]